MPRAAADRPAGRTWLWLALLLSAVLHVAVAAVLWRTERPYLTAPDARPLVFELVRTDAGMAPTGEPPRHDSPPSFPGTASAPSASLAANDEAIPVPPAPVPTPTRSPVDPVASDSRATKPAPKTSQRHARQVTSSRAGARRSSPASEPKDQRSRQPQTNGSTATTASGLGVQGRAQTTQPGAPAAERDYLSALQRAIARHQRYPASARRHGQTGVATLSFVVEADGRLRQIRLAQSSGHESLDQAALQALARLGRFDPIPKSIGRSRWSLRIPIRFDLE